MDKTAALLEAVSRGPASLADLVERTGIPRPTAHRLAVALEHHGLLDRDDTGRFSLGTRLVHWTVGVDTWRTHAEDAVRDLRDETGESAQVYRRSGEQRLCIASAEPPAGLRDTVPVGALLSMKAGSAAQVLTAWLPPSERTGILRGAAFTATTLGEVRRRGWAHSAGQREPGVASLSAPVRDRQERVIAAVSISGPIERLLKPTIAQRAALLRAARSLGRAAAGP